METNIKDLEVLQKYLTEEELKEVAKEVAYKTFSGTLGNSNPHNGANIEYYVTQGAYEAVKQYITEGGFKEEEFVEGLKDKVKEIIEGLTWYRLPLDVVVEEIINKWLEEQMKLEEEEAHKELRRRQREEQKLQALLYEF